jgi:hypothetical protein
MGKKMASHEAVSNNQQTNLLFASTVTELKRFRDEFAKEKLSSVESLWSKLEDKRNSIATAASFTTTNDRFRYQKL